MDIATSIESSKKNHRTIVGFLDDNISLHGKRINGIKVLGSIDSLNSVIKKYRVCEIILAIAKADNKLIKKILSRAKIPDWEISFKITPPLIDIMTGKTNRLELRDLSIDDILYRTDIITDNEHLRKEFTGKSILICGAGGSLGREISFQIATYNPSRLILVDSSEEHAFNVDQEIKAKFNTIAVHTIVGSTLDTAIMDMVIREFSADTIFHAAAYKHVPLSELNPFASFKNNVLGTAQFASSAEKNGVKKFIMLSSNSVEKPNGVLGISQKLSERVVLERNPSATKFNVVRFGNVLGSSGSVVPQFQRQIRDGGPVTVTSPETKRFFISIPEAVQLVLQASTFDESGVIFMLEMGEPIKIVDLAKNLIELSGLKVNEDIEIVFTGMRPGEKILAERIASDENLLKTKFDKIRMQKNGKYEPDRINRFVHDLKSHVELANIKAIYQDIKELIPEMTGPTFEEMRKNMFG
jgi:FlaA1/EpsC-like NDP-sugar epimerase